MTIIPRTLHYYLAITLDPYSIFHSTFYPRTILNLKKSRLLPLYTIPRRHKDVRIFAYIEGGEFENQPLPFIYYNGGGKASSTLSCKKRNFNLKQMNKTEIKLIGRMNNPRPH
jgi:hypothetical protein